MVLWGWDEASATEAAGRIAEAVLVLARLFIGATAVEDAAAKLLGGAAPPPSEGGEKDG